MQSIVFIDSEITNEGVIADLGAVKENAQFHSAHKQDFSNFVKGRIEYTTKTKTKPGV